MSLPNSAKFSHGFLRLSESSFLNMYYGDPQMNQKLCSAILVNFWHSCLHVHRLPFSLHFSFLLNALIQDATNTGVLALLDNPQLFGHNLHRIINPRDFELKACACNSREQCVSTAGFIMN
jgi:hypothetical protein